MREELAGLAEDAPERAARVNELEAQLEAEIRAAGPIPVVVEFGPVEPRVSKSLLAKAAKVKADKLADILGRYGLEWKGDDSLESVARNIQRLEDARAKELL
jgi:hypothetical protein